MLETIKETVKKGLATVEQATPKGSGEPIFELVISDIKERAEKGRETYGEPLKAYNGRKPLVDMYQEMLDGALYLRQYMEEQDNTLASRLFRELHRLGKNVFVSGIGSDPVVVVLTEEDETGLKTIVEFEFAGDGNKMNDMKVYSGRNSHRRLL